MTTLIPLWQLLLAAVCIAAAGGLLGAFALLRRMALVGDTLSHVALPGIALGLLFHFNPLFGSLAFLLLGTIGIWYVEHKTRLPVDTVVGVFFVTALAIGALLVPDTEILEALFGDIENLTQPDFWWATLLSFVIAALLIYFWKKFTLTLISTDLSRSAGNNPHKLELLFLLIFALTVAIGIKFVGALLMGSLVIIPAATSRNLADSMNSYLLLSALIGGAGAVVGMLIAASYGLPPGPMFILVGGAFFLLSIFFRKG